MKYTFIIDPKSRSGKGRILLEFTETGIEKAEDRL